MKARSLLPAHPLPPTRDVRSSDVREDQFLAGRIRELTELVHNLRRGRHTLLTGPRGIGKTRLMLEAGGILAGKSRRIELSGPVMARASGLLESRRPPPPILMIRHPAPLGDFLRELLQGLHERGDLILDGERTQAPWADVRKRLAGRGSVGLQEAILESLKGAPARYLVFVESFDRITPAHHGFVEELLGSAVLCGAATHMKEGGHFRRIWSSFSRIQVPPLSDAESLGLIQHCMERALVRVIDPSLYRKEVLKASGGNPFHIRNLIWHGSRESRLGEREIRLLRRSEEGDYFNMGPVYIFGVSVFTLVKLFSLGTDNREFYLWFSALGFLAYLAFRVFRAFFLFRPQKYG
ncbi:MAG: hypothetical protein WB626_03760 [Bacteroidota bacterium]